MKNESTNINNCNFDKKRRALTDYLMQKIETTNDLILEHSTLNYIRFDIDELSFIPRKGKDWTSKIDKILLFEFKNNITTKEISLGLIIGPGNPTIRERIFELAKEKNGIFNMKNETLTQNTKWIYSKKFISKDEYENLSYESLVEIIDNQFNDFKNKDLVKIADELLKLKGELE